MQRKSANLFLDGVSLESSWFFVSGGSSYRQRSIQQQQVKLVPQVSVALIVIAASVQQLLIV
eukprot:748985-Amphidinium_carterae.1